MSEFIKMRHNKTHGVAKFPKRLQGFWEAKGWKVVKDDAPTTEAQIQSESDAAGPA